jgi:diguanylate cyclase (GGDEF)-like protein/PAS domain S-box-containing protein
MAVSVARQVMGLRLVRRGYVVAVVVLVLVFSIVPAGRLPATVALSVLAASAIAYGCLVLHPPRMGAWLLVGLAVLLLGAAQALLHTSGGMVTSEPTVSTLLYLVAYLPLALGLLGLSRPPLPAREWPSTLDVVTVALAGGLVVWVALVRPAVGSDHLTWLQKAAAIGTWVGYMAVLAAYSRLVLLWWNNQSAGVLGVGILTYLVAGIFYGHTVITGPGRLSLIAEVGFLCFFALSGVAALLPAMKGIARTAIGFTRYEIGPRRLALLTAALLIAPTILFVEATTGPVTAGVAIALESAVVGVLMLLRLTLGARAHRTRGLTEEAYRAASRSLVVATATTEVSASLAAALRSMLPKGAPCYACVTEHQPLAGDGQRGTYTTLTERGDRTGELVVRVGNDSLPMAGLYTIAFSAPIRPLADLAHALEALAEQAGTALARIDLVAAFQAEERERYFRTLVLTSTDATLICRDGRIDYATPSATTMFGRDVQGVEFGDLISPSTLDHSITLRGSTVDTQETEATVYRPDGSQRAVLVQLRDLTHDPTVKGTVVTIRDVTAERDLQRSLAYRASHDSLTGLANSEVLRDQLRLDRDSTRDGRMCAVLFVDLDDFKQVNDTYGHEVGDGLLVNVASRIRACLRSDDLAARLGGDEFAGVLREVSDEDAARRTAQRIADSLARPVTVGGITIDSRASVGLAVARTPSEVDSLLRRADTALYTAKEEGKGDWREYQEGMISPIRRRNDLRIELENAMRDDTLALHYQPIVEMATGRAAGFEALIRFDRTDGSSIPPQELIRIAEENGLIVPLGDWVVRRALRDVNDLGPNAYVSVNVSPNQLRHNGFRDNVRDRLRTAGVAPGRLVLEITERLVVAEDAQAWRYLDELHADGVRIAIDDYGTGCASLSYLRQNSIDIVKIDRSFVQDVDGARERALLEALVGLTARLDLIQIAEGVETAHGRDTLRDLGCRYAQGYYYSPPVPLPAAASFARRS